MFGIPQLLVAALESVGEIFTNKKPKTPEQLERQRNIRRNNRAMMFFTFFCLLLILIILCLMLLRRV